ncbi:MAG: DNA-binding IclR family transcriptional regulator [Paracoccaceae bacterium]|jgi:DNA-binding IclR family transcriptional regulator
MSDKEFEAAPKEAKDRNFVTALARGLDVLRCFRPGEMELTNTDISARTSLPKPTVSRLTHTLCRLDYLVADSRNNTYRLGAGVLGLGFGVLSGLEIAERVKDVLGELRNGPNSYITSALGERHRCDVIYVAVRLSRENVSLSMHVGSRLPLFRSAMGRAILVGMAESDRVAVFEMARLEEPDGEDDRQAIFAKAQSEYQSRGFCTSYGDWRGDVNAVAVPVFSLNGSQVYGLNAGGPTFHVKKKQLESHYAPLLIQAAKSLGQRP